MPKNHDHDDFDENEYYFEDQHEPDDETEDHDYPVELESNGFDSIPKELRDVVSNKGKYYITNAELLPAIREAKAQGKITEKLAKMIMLLADRYSRKFCFVGYSYRDEMVSEAILNLARTALSFNEERSLNPFGFYSKAIENSFLQYMHKEKVEHYIRDTSLIRLGHDPSANYSSNIITKKVAASTKRGSKNQQNQLTDDILVEAPVNLKTKK